MAEQQHIDYLRIERAIEYIREHIHEQPTLDSIAASIHLSTYHFQRMFTEWAGVSPKKFTQFLTIEYAKRLLSKQKISIASAAHETGLSGSSRLHDLFINIEGMTPGEYKNGGEGLVIKYHFSDSVFGRLIIASTYKGICHLFFVEDDDIALVTLKKRFPKARYEFSQDELQQTALSFLKNKEKPLQHIKLHLAGTPFQLKVWQSLLTVPQGALTSYGDIAEQAGNKKAARAVGSAIGANPIAFLIPCHRVIQRSGNFGQYMWGANKKASLIGWEAAMIRE